MRAVAYFLCGLLLGTVAGHQAVTATGTSPPAKDKQGAADAPVEVYGQTRCILNRQGVIAPTVLRPVVEVLAAPGERVKKGQVLVRLDDSEPRAKVRAKEAALRHVRISRNESRQYLERVEATYKKGGMPEQRYYEARGNASRAEMDEQAARSELSAAEAERELYQVTAPVAGVISWLEVHPGMVSWPGGTVWGEVVDLSEIDVRCDLTPAQAEQVAVGQAAEVRPEGKEAVAGSGRVVFVGKMADRASGLVPVLVRLANPQERLRGEVGVRVRFRDEPARQPGR
jgi:RND family efflux transporter MFP subunit